MLDDTPIIDLRGCGRLPRLELTWLCEPQPVYQLHARRFWAQQLLASGDRLIEVDPAGRAVVVSPDPMPTILCTMEDVLKHIRRGTLHCERQECRRRLPEFSGRLVRCAACNHTTFPRQHRIGVYESGGPTAAPPGAQWLTREPYPWNANPYLRFKQWERPLRLCEVSPVDWPQGWGWITASWRLFVEGDQEVIDQLANLWRQVPTRCPRCQERSFVRCRHNRPPRALYAAGGVVQRIYRAERLGFYGSSTATPPGLSGRLRLKS